MRYKSILLLCVAPLIISCGPTYFYSVFEAKSPANKGSLRIMRNLKGYASDYKFRIETLSGNGVQVIYRDDLESSLGLIEAQWEADGSRVSLLACNRIGPTARLDYDFSKQTTTKRETDGPAILASIKRRYSLPDDVDVAKWACSDDGTLAYRQRNGVQ